MNRCLEQNVSMLFSSIGYIRFWPPAAVTFIYLFRPFPSHKWWLHDKSIQLLGLFSFFQNRCVSCRCVSIKRILFCANVKPRILYSTKYWRMKLNRKLIWTKCSLENVKHFCVSVREQRGRARPGCLCLYVSQRHPGNPWKIQTFSPWWYHILGLNAPFPSECFINWMSFSLDYSCLDTSTN